MPKKFLKLKYENDFKMQYSAPELKTYQEQSLALSMAICFRKLFIATFLAKVG